MLVLGLLAGFGGGFVVGQRLAVPPPPRAVDVPRPAPGSGIRDAGSGVPAPPLPSEPVPIETALPEPVPAATIVETPEPRTRNPEPRNPDPGSRIPDPGSRIPASRPATVRFESRPPGATIYLDDVRLGVTPLAITTVTPGTHQVRMEMLGHDTWRSSVTLKEGEQIFVRGSLE